MKRILLTLCLLLTLTAPLNAQVYTGIPANVNFQGRLAKPDGTPVTDGTYALTFRLFAGLTGGTALWSQTNNSVTVHNGTFSLPLNLGIGYTGSNSPDSTLALDPYLETQVGANTLAPRQRLASVVYALHSDIANIALTVPNGAIGAAQLANGAVTASKLDSASSGVLSHFTGTPLTTGSISVGSAPYYVTTPLINSVRYAFVVNLGAANVQIYSLQNPTAPTLVSTLATGTGPVNVVPYQINGVWYAFVGNYYSNTVSVFSLSLINAPTLINTITAGTNPGNLAVTKIGTSVYLFIPNSGSNNLQIMNVSLPGAPTFAGSIMTQGYPFDVVLNGTTAYVACANSGSIQAFNVNVPATPALVSTTAGVPAVIGLALTGNTLLAVTQGNNTLQVYDVSGVPTLKSTVTTGANAFRVSVSGSTAYVACRGTGEVDIVDVSSPSLPSVRNVIGDQNGTTSAAANAGYLYAGQYNTSKLAILDLSALSVSLANTLAVSDNVSVGNALNVDSSGRGRVGVPYALTFGAPTTGEGIGSNRQDNSAGANPFGLDFYTNFTPRLVITNGGYVGINDTSPAYVLELPNVANASGQGRANAWVTYSSGRWKHNVTDIDGALDKVLHLRGVEFDWNAANGGSHDVGFVAEEVGRVVPALVEYEAGKPDALGMKYDRVTALLVEAVKTQQKEITELKAEVRSLRKEMGKRKH